MIARRDRPLTLYLLGARFERVIFSWHETLHAQRYLFASSARDICRLRRPFDEGDGF